MNFFGFRKSKCNCLKHLTKEEALRLLIQDDGVNSGAARKKPPPRPARRTIYSPTRDHAAHVIMCEDSNSNFTLNRSYNGQSLVTYLYQCFTIIKKIGEGSFSNVYKVQDKETLEMYALKISKYSYQSSQDRDRKLREVKLHTNLRDNPNCIKIYNAWEQDCNLFIQVELCPTTLEGLLNYSRKHKCMFDEESVWEILFEILQGLNNLHQHNLVHMDVKTANIMISEEGVCKLGDFGLGLDLGQAVMSYDEEEGDPKYISKEVLAGKYTKSGDIFSVGIIILEIATSIELPPNGPFWHAIRDGLITDADFNHTSQELKEIILSMLHPVAARRPSCTELLAHPKIYRRTKYIARGVRTTKNLLTQIASMLVKAVTTLTRPIAQAAHMLAVRYGLHELYQTMVESTRRRDAAIGEELSYAAFENNLMADLSDLHRRSGYDLIINRNGNGLNQHIRYPSNKVSTPLSSPGPSKDLRGPSYAEWEGISPLPAVRRLLFDE